MKNAPFFLVMFFLVFLYSCSSNDEIGQKPVELNPYPDELQAVIGRGLIALPKDQNRIFLSWRLLPNDPEAISFNVYRKQVANDEEEFELIGKTALTSYIDSQVLEGKQYLYAIKPIFNGKQVALSRATAVTAERKGRNALIFNIGQDYKFARVATGDLNGDGQLEVVIAYANTSNVDPYKYAWKKSQDTIKVAAFLRTGERLWTIDLGWGIEAGAVYSPIVIWDIDADGRAEVLLKTNRSGNRLDYESERLTVLDGETGAVRNEAKWPVIEGHFAEDYNNNSRNYIAVAHLDGKNPYIIVARGLYKTQVIWAYDNKFKRVWERTVGRDLHTPVKNKWLKRIWHRFFKDKGHGSHSLPIADINNDGKEEIMWGEHCIGENGKDLWVIKDHMPYRGQPDIVFVADVLPSHEGKEIFYCREGWYGRQNERIGMLLANSKGKTIWAHWGYTHVDGGWVARILADQEGLQFFAFDISKKMWNTEGASYGTVSSFLWSADGKLVDNPPRSWVMSFPVDWDGDGVREICMENGDVQKYNGPIVVRLGGYPLWGADLYGDHREEIVAAPQDGKVYIFFNTEIIKSPPKITPVADRQYRNDLSRTAMQFYVIPTEGGYMPISKIRKTH
jgi:hypothetical protein